MLPAPHDIYGKICDFGPALRGGGAPRQIREGVLAEDHPEAASVTVTAPARLHLGFLDLNGGLGRRFGSIGLAIERPASRLSICRSATQEAEGPEAERALRHLAKLTNHLGLRRSYRLKIHEAIPAHAGLGSGTQLALAVASALRRLEGLPLAIPSDAQLLRRGARSGIGLGVFEHGGLVVDGGRGGQTMSPPLIARLEFPAEWRVLVVLDPQSRGVHGAEEQAAFAGLGEFSAASAAEICRLVLIKALPALAERDIGSFGDAITRVQEVVGDYFAPAQGGAPYASAAVAQIVNELRAHGAHGTGQSSWGPTGFAFAASPAEARRVAGLARDNAASLGLGVLICKGVNRGALIESGALAGIR